MFNKIYDILVDFLGESKQGSFIDGIYQYQFGCPRCIQNYGENEIHKHNLEVNLKKNVFQCWKCSNTDDDMKGSIGKLIKMYGSVYLYKQFKNIIEEYKASSMYFLDALDGNNIQVEQTIYLPKSFKKVDLKKCENKKVIDYLNKRNITQTIIDTFNIGYTSYDEVDWSWRNRIIIPSYDVYGDLNYFVGRDFTGKSKLKYKNCNINKKNIVFQEHLINYDSNIILVEGAIDCLFGPVGRTISLLGKTLTKDCLLYQNLYKKCNGTITICLDADTNINETKRIYTLLNFGRLKGKIRYIRLKNEKDFGELFEKYERYGIINAIRSTKDFNEFDLVY